MAGKFLDQNGFSLAFVFLNVKSRIHPAADCTSIHTCVMDNENLLNKKVGIKNENGKNLRRVLKKTCVWVMVK